MSPEIILSLEKANIFTQDVQKSLEDLNLTHGKIQYLQQVLSHLQEAGILTLDNYTQAIQHQHPYSLGGALYHLKEARALNQDNFNLVVKDPDPTDLGAVLSYLKKNAMLTAANQNIAAQSPNHSGLSRALCYLEKSGILNQGNFALIAQYPNVHFALHHLSTCGILNQQNFTSLFSANHKPLISGKAARLIWAGRPNHLLTQVNFEQLLTAAEQHNPLMAPENLIGQILHVPNEMRPAQAFNNQPSSHISYGLWANRHSSPANQREFDRQYGLVVLKP